MLGPLERSFSSRVENTAPKLSRSPTARRLAALLRQGENQRIMMVVIEVL